MPPHTRLFPLLSAIALSLLALLSACDPEAPTAAPNVIHSPELTSQETDR